MQAKQLAAEVLDHLRSTLDAELLTSAFTQARARSAAVKAQRRQEAAVKVCTFPELTTQLVYNSSCRMARFSQRTAVAMSTV